MLVNVSDIMSRVRVAASMEDAAPGAGTVTDATLLQWVNYEHRNLQAHFLRLGLVLSESSEDITLTGAATYAMTADPMAILSVDLVEGDNLIPMRSSHTSSVYRYADNSTSAGWGNATYYRVQVNDTGTVTFKFYPNPSSGTVRVFYAPTPSTLTSASTVNYAQGWEELIVLRCARRCLAKIEAVNPALEAEVARVESTVDQGVLSRLAYSRPKIQDVDTFNGINDSPWDPGQFYFV